MKQFKKRTIALVLASVITVAGAFGAERYKNSLMGVSFQNTENGQVNMTLQTQKEYTPNVSLIRRAPGVYMVMLPEFNNQAPAPDLKDVAGNIKNIEIRTMPYTTSGNGYTKITVTTTEGTMLSVDKTLYISSQDSAALLPASHTDEIVEEEKHISEPETNMSQEQNAKETRETENAEPDDGFPKTPSYNKNSSSSRRNIETTGERNSVQPVTNSTVTTATAPKQESQNTTATETVLLILGFLFIIAASIYFFVRAKNKLAEIAGEQVSIDLDDTDNKKKKKKKKKEKTEEKGKERTSTFKLKKIKNENPIDVTYVQAADDLSQAVIQTENENKEENEAVNIVDLDEIFQDKENSGLSGNSVSSEDEEENLALEDFLSGFSFDEELLITTEQEETPGYDENYYEKIIHDDNLIFDKDDTEKVNQLLNTEITDSTLRNIKDFAKSGQEKKIPTKQEILEDLVTTYAVAQDIIFTKEDVEALNKLITVEIDPDFLTDLRTNPERAKEMQAEIEKQKDKPHKASEILTLNVKDMLPNLSEALRKQGGKRIESEVKPTTVYFSEGYDFDTLSVKDILPDLSKGIDSLEANQFKPSEDIQYADTSYQVEKLSIANMLPDLSDVLKNPEKYEDPKPKPVEVDEEALLKNITNVQFKPFDDGSRDFEVLNEFDDSNAPSVSDIQKEFSQFENFEIANQDEYYSGAQNDYDDFEAFYRNDFVDLDKQYAADRAAGIQNEKSLFEPAINPDTEAKQIDKNIESGTGENTENKTNLQKISEKSDLNTIPKKIATNDEILKPAEMSGILESEKKVKAETPVREISQVSAELQKKLAQSREERMARRARIMLKKQEIISSVENKNKEPKAVLEYNNETYTILSSANFTSDTGCHLVKNKSGYAVFGFVGNKLQKIKQYALLKSEKIQTRLSENLDNNKSRYIVRIGIHKFVVNVSDSDIEYVMDLC